jgi:hypothetical protein
MDLVDEAGGFLGGPADGDPEVYRWLDRHAWEYGFMNSYPPNAGDPDDRFETRTYRYTKYIVEPWHWRFVGRHAARVHHLLAAATDVRYSTHELIDLLAAPTPEVAGPLAAALAEVGKTVEQLEDPHPADAAARERALAAAGCYSDTVGATVEHGACVQVTREGCGEPSCGWYRCEEGEFACVEPAACDADVFAHADCPAP